MSAEVRRRWGRLTAWVLFGAFVGVEQPACGGIVREGPGDGGVGAGGSPGELPSGKGGRTGGASGAPAKPACGNGRLDKGEECDTADFASATCATQTMGALPAGSLACTTSCRISTGLCHSAGSGGAPGTGGRPSTGGAPGIGTEACYAASGVPDPDRSGACFTGDSAIKACGTQLSRDPEPHNGCEVSCGCSACSSLYSKCAADGGCEWILACARDAASSCTDIKSCYVSGCQFIIDTAGGLDSVGARIASSLLPCLSKQDCLLKCR